MKTKETLIIIEDEKELRNTISEMLEISGYEVLTASNGKEGCKLIFNNKADLVVCDVNMPQMDGFEVLRTVNKEMENKLVPAFLFLTARVQLDDIKEGMKLGADDYITKPFTIKDLIDSIELRLEKRRKLLNHIDPDSANGGLFKFQPQKHGKIALPFENGFRYIEFKSILKCEAERSYCNFFLDGGEKILVSKPMRYFEDTLEQHGFLKVHRSFMVNPTYVDTYIRGKGGYIVLKDGSSVNVASNKKEGVMSALQNQ